MVQSGVNLVCVTHCLLLKGGVVFFCFLAGFKGVPDNLNSIPERERNQHKEDGDTCK